MKLLGIIGVDLDLTDQLLHSSDIGEKLEYNETVHQLFVNFKKPYDSVTREVKVKSSLYRPWRPLEFREVEAPTFWEIRLTNGEKVISPTRQPLFTPRKIPGTYFCQRLNRPQGHNAAGRIRSTDKIHLIWDSNCYLPARSIVSQPTTLDDGGFGVWIPAGARIFYSPSRPDWFWGPTNLMSNGYRRRFSWG
jgi:hypothetical protein